MDIPGGISKKGKMPPFSACNEKRTCTMPKHLYAHAKFVPGNLFIVQSKGLGNLFYRAIERPGWNGFSDKSSQVVPVRGVATASDSCNSFG